MEKNIFEDAKFGDKFVTRDGKWALFDEAYDNNRYSLFVQGVYGNIGYHSDGTLCGNLPLDKEIVSRYEEPINEEKLDKNSHNYKVGYNDGLVDGYRRAMEEQAIKAIEKQRQIDIDKAIMWMESYFPEELDGYQFEFVKREEIINDFRKAMEE